MKSSKKRAGLAIAAMVLAGTFTLVGAEAANAALPGPPRCIPQSQTATKPPLNQDWEYIGAWFSAGHAGYKYSYYTEVDLNGWVNQGQVLCTVS